MIAVDSPIKGPTAIFLSPFASKSFSNRLSNASPMTKYDPHSRNPPFLWYPWLVTLCIDSFRLFSINVRHHCSCSSPYYLPSNLSHHLHPCFVTTPLNQIAATLLVLPYLSPLSAIAVWMFVSSGFLRTKLCSLLLNHSVIDKRWHDQFCVRM